MKRNEWVIVGVLAAVAWFSYKRSIAGGGGAFAGGAPVPSAAAPDFDWNTFDVLGMNTAAGEAGVVGTPILGASDQ